MERVREKNERKQESMQERVREENRGRGSKQVREMGENNLVCERVGLCESTPRC